MPLHSMNGTAHTATTSVNADLIASTTARCGLSSKVTVSPYIVAQAGYAVAVRALEEKPHYNEIECLDGTFQTIRAGDVIVGVLGERQALKGYSGTVPRQVQVGDTLHVLNLGGIIGRCASALPDLGPALRVEVLGSVVVERNGRPVHARIQDGAIEPQDTLSTSAPLVMVSGTAMNTGKTMAACGLVEGLSDAGYDVAAAKLTGASLKRDVRKMVSHGARTVSTFTDAGVVCSTQGDMAPVAKGIIGHLNASAPDVIVLELGDGFIGYYGVDDLLVDRELQQLTAAHVVAATDLAGAWAAERVFFERYRAAITAITGPVTDNAVGRRYIRTQLGIPAVNALQQSQKLTAVVDQAVHGGNASGSVPSPVSATPNAAPEVAGSAA